MPEGDATIPPDAPTRGFDYPPAPAAAWDGSLPRQFGRYRLERKLGEGGMGAVFLAHDDHLDRAVALKIPFLAGGSADPFFPRFLREGRAAAGLRHPHLCPLFDLGEIDGTPYLSMALIRGEPLSRRVGPGRVVAPAEAVALVRKVAGAMAEAHRHKVIHRDLKPGNVMIDEAGEPIVLDFGLARRDDGLSALTAPGQVMGTPAYMPPEQLNGEADKIGPGCDIYSLGVMLFELLTGDVPFHGDLIAMAGQVMCDPAPPPSSRRPGLDPALDRLVLRALAKKPEDRWPGMREFAAALGEWQGRNAELGVRNAELNSAYPIPHSALFLTLMVEGTPHAYRAAPRQDVVTVGRQRRKPGEPDDVGNDFVVRVAGNDALSARISRRHLEIRREAGGFTATDRSKAGTLHNGVLLPQGTPVPLAHGDKLVIAGVVGLTVELDHTPRVVPAVGEVAVPVAGGPSAGRVLLEASVGDMVTVG